MRLCIWICMDHVFDATYMWSSERFAKRRPLLQQQGQWPLMHLHLCPQRFKRVPCLQGLAVALGKEPTMHWHQYFFVSTWQHESNIPSRGKPRQRFERFWETVVFAIAKLLIFITKMLEFSRGKSGGFYMLSCNLQGILSSKGARSFSLFQLAILL